MGQGKMTVTDDELVRMLTERGDAAYVTSEIAEMCDMTNEGVRGRLEELAREGRIGYKKPNNRLVLWWPAENQGREAFSA
jgi:predicted ArsR family transcriptional regulator